MNIFQKLSDLLAPHSVKIDELKIIKKKYDRKGYTHLSQIPDSDPDKKRWIELMAACGVVVSDPVNKAKAAGLKNKVCPMCAEHSLFKVNNYIHCESCEIRFKIMRFNL